MPNYICRNRHGTYYFRFIIPAALIPQFSNRREIRRSLKTDSKKLAVRRARVYRIHFDLLEDMLRKMTKNIKTDLIHAIDVFGNEFTVDYDGDVEKELRAVRQSKADAIEQAVALGIEPASFIKSQTDTTIPSESGTKKQTPTISLLSCDFLELKLTRSKLAEKTVDDYGTSHALLPFILGEDKRVGDLTNDDFETFYSDLKHIPTSHNSDTKYKDKSFLELKKMRLPKERLPDVSTRNKHFSRVKTLLKYAVDRGDISRNPADSVMIEKNTTRAKDKRKIFDTEDLRTIFLNSYFTSHEWQKGQRRRDAEPYRFWMYPLALFTGARQGELLQLERKDVVQGEDEIWYIDIREEFDKVTGKKIRSTKNKNSIRRVPLSDTLVEMGFINFSQSRRSKLLFPELNTKKDGKDAAQKFLNEQLKRWGVHEKNVKTFHSLRHVFVTQAVNQNIDPRHIGGVTGHLNKDEFHGVAEIANTYNKGFTSAVLKKEVLDVLDYGLDFDVIKW